MMEITKISPIFVAQKTQEIEKIKEPIRKVDDIPKKDSKSKDEEKKEDVKRKEITYTMVNKQNNTTKYILQLAISSSSLGTNLNTTG